MKVLIDHHEPFALSHGGFQIQIEETAAALREIGVEIEFLRWWDAGQTGDILHFFGLPPIHLVERAKSRGLKVVVTHLLTNTCNRSPARLALQASATRTLLSVPALRSVSAKFGWISLRTADGLVVGLQIERDIMSRVWGVESHRIHQVPLGLRTPFLHAAPAEKSGPLITVGTIAARKRIVPLCHLALEAKVPLLVVGKSHAEDDPEWLRFKSLCDGKLICHHPHVDDPDELVRLYRESRGYVHYSEGENWCFSAHEAAACGLPLLLPDQPWSRERFGQSARFFRQPGSHAADLKQFFKECQFQTLSHPASVSWHCVARQLSDIYASL